MSKRLVLVGLSALLAWAGAGSAARARVIDTFSFSNSSGWNTTGTFFSGSFTGTVEPDGLIEMSDLTSFQISGVAVFVIPFGDAIKSDLTLFSYNTKGGASSLAFIWRSPSLAATVCSGAPSVLSLACNPGGNNPPTTVADIIIGGPTVTPDLTTATLVSSVTVPEPSTWVMMLLGFAGAGFAGYDAIKKRRPAIAAA